MWRKTKSSRNIRELAAAGKKPFSAFTIGVAVNVILGFVLSVLILGNYWINAVK